MKKLLLFLLLFPLASAFGQTFMIDSVRNPFVHTFSIVARDSITGEMGVAVQSHWFSVGSVVSWAEAGVGAVATQSLVNPSFGIRGLELLKKGKTAKEAVEELIASDTGGAFRQLAIVDAKGNAFSYTGNKCIPEAGNIMGKGFSTEANLMLNDKVPGAMAKAFREAKGPLAERMIAALEAGQAVGGDIRGQQSAAILIVKGTSSGKIWEDKLVDLRVEDNPHPIQELKRLLTVFRAYEHMNNGDAATEKSDWAKALKEYGEAEKMFPDNLEMKFWHAVNLVNKGKIDDSLPLFKEIFAKEKNWIILLPRLSKVGLLTADDATLKRMLDQGK
jgi:uncharacterized Ntn-hydrolase superfamily protein